MILVNLSGFSLARRRRKITDLSPPSTVWQCEAYPSNTIARSFARNMMTDKPTKIASLAYQFKRQRTQMIDGFATFLTPTFADVVRFVFKQQAERRMLGENILPCPLSLLILFLTTNDSISNMGRPSPMKMKLIGFSIK